MRSVAVSGHGDARQAKRRRISTGKTCGYCCARDGRTLLKGEELKHLHFLFEDDSD